MQTDSNVAGDAKVELVRLKDGRRVLRVSDASGLCLEKKADEGHPIRRQAQQLAQALKSLRLEPVPF